MTLTVLNVTLTVLKVTLTVLNGALTVFNVPCLTSRPTRAGREEEEAHCLKPLHAHFERGGHYF